MSEKTIVHSCENVGCASAGPVFIQRTESGNYEARQAVGFMGSMNMDSGALDAIDWNPFHADFHDNFVRGIADTEAEALATMEKDHAALTELMWAF